MKSACDSGHRLFLINNSSLNQDVPQNASFWLQLFKDLVMSAQGVSGDGYANHCGRG